MGNDCWPLGVEYIGHWTVLFHIYRQSPMKYKKVVQFSIELIAKGVGLNFDQLINYHCGWTR